MERWPSYCRWETRALAPCPVTCGGGRVPLAVRCVRLDHGRRVPLPHSECWQVPRPHPVEDCSPEPCPARWGPSQGDSGPRHASLEVASSPPCKLLTLGALTCRRGSIGVLEGCGGFKACESHHRGSGMLWAHVAGGSFVITCSSLSTCHAQRPF